MGDLVPASPDEGADGACAQTHAQAVERRARDLLAQLSSAEKLALLEGDTDFWPGMVDIASRDASHVHPWPAGAVPRLGLKGLQFVDGPRGVVLKGGATTFPPPIARGACWDVDLEERIGAAMAMEARAFGANWLAAVCVNLLRHPGWGRAQETYGEDPVLLGALGAAMTCGIQRHAVACVKHFALNSIDSSRFLVDVQASQRVLHELYLPQFRDCVEAGAMAVMSAYNSVNGEWCGQHAQLLNDILKNRWGFRGFVLTDFIFGLRDGVKGILAGQDLEMPFPMIFAASLPQAVASGRVPLARIDDAVLRLLQAQFLLPNRTQGADAYPVSIRGCAKHRALARQAATASIVLLKNAGPVLPLRGIGSLAMVGRLAVTANLGDHGSSDTRPTAGSVLTPLDGLRAAAPGIRVQYADGANRAAAASLAAACDAAVVVVGLDWRQEGEHIHNGDLAPILGKIPPPGPLLRRFGRSRLEPLWTSVAGAIASLAGLGSALPGGDFSTGDRTELRLPAQQEQLILSVVAANPRTIVVLMGGGAILCEAWRHQVPALLVLWYPGMEGGAALADVLLGNVSPSGRMPFAVPTAHEHLPCFDPRARRITYDLWHGYRRLAWQGHPAAFPFGYGLSYSTFAHGQATAEIVGGCGEAGVLRVAVTVANVGGMAATDVVQVYFEPPAQMLERSPRSLVGFRRVTLDSGQVERVSLDMPLRRLAYFDEAADTFVLEGGRHRVVVARHAEDEGIGVDIALDAAVIGP